MLTLRNNSCFQLYIHTKSVERAMNQDVCLKVLRCKLFCNLYRHVKMHYQRSWYAFVNFIVNKWKLPLKLITFNSVTGKSLFTLDWQRLRLYKYPSLSLYVACFRSLHHSLTETISYKILDKIWKMKKLLTCFNLSHFTRQLLINLVFNVYIYTLPSPTF